MKLVLRSPELTRPASDRWRVAAKVDGEEVFFEAGVPLSPRVEALVCAFLLPAMARGRNLDVRAPLTPALADNLNRARALARRWWPQLRGGQLRAEPAGNRPRAVAEALFYTGGVDSSFALRQLQHKVNELVFVEGFDVSLREPARLEQVRTCLQHIAAATGHRLITVRTNLREHRTFQKLNWEITHIAALAAVAHTLAERFGTLYVAHSDVPPPFGSHPDFDPLWSSDEVAIVNFGAGYSRLERVRAISQWPPLRGRLRVCPEDRVETLNCGRCEKCLRTRLQLLAAGDPSAMDSFPDVPLVEMLELVVKTDAETRFPHFWREVQAALSDKRLRELIGMLLSHQPGPSLQKRLKHLWRRRFRFPAAGI